MVEGARAGLWRESCSSFRLSAVGGAAPQPSRFRNANLYLALAPGWVGPTHAQPAVCFMRSPVFNIPEHDATSTDGGDGVGLTVGTINATDRDGDTLYFLLDGVGSSQFRINSTDDNVRSSATLTDSVHPWPRTTDTDASSLRTPTPFELTGPFLCGCTHLSGRAAQWRRVHPECRGVRL